MLKERVLFCDARLEESTLIESAFNPGLKGQILAMHVLLVLIFEMWILLILI